MIPSRAAPAPPIDSRPTLADVVLPERRFSRLVPKQARAEDTLRMILLAADLVLSETGRERFSVKKVARRAGVCPGAIYRYFASRERLLAALELPLWKALGERRDAFLLVGATVFDVVRTLVDSVREEITRRDARGSAVQTPPSPDEVAPVVRLLRDALLARGLSVDDEQLSLCAVTVVGTCLLDRSLERGEALARALTRLLTASHPC
jgi:AcrR family transcriptional regulator